MSMAGLPKKIRAFVAIRVSRRVEGAIAALIDELRKPQNGIKWVSHANLHLTLKFLGGAVEIEKIEALRPGLEAVASETAPFDLVARGVGGFPNINRPRVIWVGLEAPELFTLAKRVEDAAAQRGFEREKRAFTGHLTIARLDTPRHLDALGRAIEQAREREFGVSRIESMTLYRSTLTPAGAVYDALAVFRLRAS